MKKEKFTTEKEILIREIKESVEEMKLILMRKKKAKNASDFLLEITDNLKE